MEDQRKKSESDKNYQDASNQEIRAKLQIKYRDDISRLKE